MATEHERMGGARAGGARARGRAAIGAAIGAAIIALGAPRCVPDYAFVDAPDAGGDDGGSEAEASTCPHATYPPPPQAQAGAGVTELVFAIRSIDFGEAVGSTLGLDLDGVCTCQGEGASCAPPSPTDESCDLPDGRDNASSAIIKLFALASGFGAAEFSADAEAGAWSVLLRVREYNGEADDQQVRLDWYVTNSFAALNMGVPPAWDGTDAWPISTENLAGGGSTDSIHADPNAWVANRQLVASLPELPLRFAGTSSSRFEIGVTGAVVVATLEEDPGLPGQIMLRDGLVAGRWTEAGVFASLSSFRDDGGGPICTSDFVYNQGKNAVCRARDILEGPGSPATPCDALSFALGFTASPAALGAPFAPVVPPPGCPPESDPANDSCAL